LPRPHVGHPRSLVPAQGALSEGDPVNTRTIAVIALIIAVIVLLLLVL
jgi:hypothetical protein